MKGLLRKDWYMIRSYCRILVLMCLIFLAVGVISPGNNFFFLAYPVLLGGVLPVTLLSYDERFHWPLSCDTMPLSRETVVDERYLLSLLCFGAFFLLSLAVQGGVRLLGRETPPPGALAALLLPMGLLPTALMLPVIYRWGVEKGRIVYYVIIGAVTAAGLIFAEASLTPDSTVSLRGGLLSVLLSLGLFAASWLLSRRIYGRREL